MAAYELSEPVDPSQKLWCSDNYSQILQSLGSQEGRVSEAARAQFRRRKPDSKNLLDVDQRCILQQLTSSEVLYPLINMRLFSVGARTAREAW